MANLFDKMLADGVRAGQIPARTQGARDWFRETASGKRVTEGQLKQLQTDRIKGGFQPGSMYLFKYDAKYKNVLPYWDAMPLVFPLKPAEGGFYGLNLHYLQPQMRATLMDGLYDTTNNSRFDESTRVNISAAFLDAASKADLIKPCLKRYLNSHVYGGFTYIHPSEWDIALFLPLADWQNATWHTVYKNSRRMVRG